MQGQALLERLDSVSQLDSPGYAPALVRYAQWKKNYSGIFLLNIRQTSFKRICAESSKFPEKYNF